MSSQYKDNHHLRTLPQTHPVNFRIHSIFQAIMHKQATCREFQQANLISKQGNLVITTSNKQQSSHVYEMLSFMLLK